jgi:enoyl-CoA hydratase/carnithine racemase
MLRFAVGEKNAQTIAYQGSMHSADEAQRLGLVDQVFSEDTLAQTAHEMARDLASRGLSAFCSTKGLLCKPAVQEMIAREQNSIQEFVEIWYSSSTWKNLQTITIRA